MATHRLTRVLLTLALLLLAMDVTVWFGHVLWRDSNLGGLDPLVGHIERLAEQVAADDDWIEKNHRLLEGYGQHDEYAARLVERGRRATAHNALVRAYNSRVVELHRRFYFAPLPPPQPRLLDSIATGT